MLRPASDPIHLAHIPACAPRFVIPSSLKRKSGLVVSRYPSMLPELDSHHDGCQFVWYPQFQNHFRPHRRCPKCPAGGCKRLRAHPSLRRLPTNPGQAIVLPLGSLCCSIKPHPASGGWVPFPTGGVNHTTVVKVCPIRCGVA